MLVEQVNQDRRENETLSQCVHSYCCILFPHMILRCKRKGDIFRKRSIQKYLNSQKLLEIVKAIPIEKELETQNELRNLDKGRSAVRIEMSEDSFNEMNKIFNFNDEYNTLEITNKQTVW